MSKARKLYICWSCTPKIKKNLVIEYQSDLKMYVRLRNLLINLTKVTIRTNESSAKMLF